MGIGLTRPVRWALAALLLLGMTFALGSSCAGPDPVYVTHPAADSLRRAATEAREEADAHRKRADSLELQLAARVDTVRERITRWRTRVDTLTVTEVVALADSTIDACERAVDGCEETVAAKDSVIDWLAQSERLSVRRAELATEQWHTCTDRVVRLERVRPYRDALATIIGFSGGFLLGR